MGGKPVTLIDCIASHSTSYLMSVHVEEQEVVAERALLGVWINDEDAQVFSAVRIELENLTEWDYRADVVHEIERDQSLPRGSRWRIAVDPVTSLTVEVDDVTVELGRWYRLPSHDLRRNRLASATFAASQVTVRSMTPRSVAEWIDTVQVFQDLLTLAMGAPCGVLKQTLTPMDELREDEHAEAREKTQLYARQIVVGDPDERGVRGGDALFTLGVEGIEHQILIPRWFEVREKFRITCDMILGLLYIKGGYIQTQLITAVAAAQAMHEALALDPPMPDSEFKALKKALKKDVPDNRKQWLSEKLGSNTHTLRQRLLDLASQPDAEAMRQLLSNPDAWADAAKNSRHLVAHGGKSSTDVNLLYAITKVTTAVVVMNLLHQLRIPRERLMYVTDNNRALREAASLSRRYWPSVGPEAEGGDGDDAGQ